MNATNMAFITVGGNRYPIDKLNPLDAIDFGSRVAAVVMPTLGGLVGAVDGLNGDPANMKLDGKIFREAFIGYKSEETAALMKDALAQCYTPQNEPLNNQAVFNAWFQEHPGDLFQLGAMAVYELVKDFFPSHAATLMTAFQTKMRAATQASTQ